ncbi:MAG: NADH-quinone oxidoreductase subunit L [Gammaproteobacteria bacterium]|nr:NADH-quinone oxidoreductase subunit L [Gammaproteobacteria bacterium]NNJ49464.1 NADH-quinone oxidoreductase subunit L [Gammaproteobacteria bacterium]
MENIYLAIPLAPLFGAIIAGFFGAQIGRKGAHSVTILGVGISFILSLVALNHHVFNGAAAYNDSVYIWMVSDNIRFEVGFLVDNLTVMMMSVVTGVSLMVHIYTIGYMADDLHNWPKESLAGTNAYQRFFSYISLFTFSMLMLVMANNFMQLFFGWEAVGLVSYLLIGFWSVRPTAVYANLKAFLVNRVGDFGFILGIAAVVMYTGSLDYYDVFAKAESLSSQSMSIFSGTEWSVISVICILLFVGAMGKSAQIPLHVWLPDSMEGPTPISALIHAATMVTAGIFMVTRMSPLYEWSDAALSFIIVIGALTAFLMGLIGIVQNDIKRVVAYSTLSQLGYMTVALGASAYSAAVFHLMTHAFFKALLFLAAGSVIIAMHHEQDMRKMGGLKKYMPITYWTSLVGSLALIGFPGFSGFFSKDAIIEAVHHSNIPGHEFAYMAVLSGVFITAFYTFRMFFLVFHGEERMDQHTREHLHETPWVVTVPLILLAIPSVFIGGFTIGDMLFGDYFGSAVYIADNHTGLAEVGKHFHGAWAFVEHAFAGPAIYLAALGVFSAWFIYMKQPDIATNMKNRFIFIYRLLDNKYYMDDINAFVFGGGSRTLGDRLWKVGDVTFIDGLLVNGSARLVGWFAGVTRRLQTGMLYHYAFAMIIGVLMLFAIGLIV